MSQKLGWNLSHIVPCMVWLGIGPFLNIDLNSSHSFFFWKDATSGERTLGEEEECLRAMFRWVPNFGTPVSLPNYSCLCTSVGAVWTVGFTLPEDAGQVFFIFVLSWGQSVCDCLGKCWHSFNIATPASSIRFKKTSGEREVLGLGNTSGILWICFLIPHTSSVFNLLKLTAV